MTSLASSIRRVADPEGGILLDTRRGTMLGINPLGSKILDLLDKGDSLGQIAERISTEFSVALQIVQTDIAEFLNALEAHGVLDSRSPKK